MLTISHPVACAAALLADAVLPGDNEKWKVKKFKSIFE